MKENDSNEQDIGNNNKSKNKSMNSNTKNNISLKHNFYGTLTNIKNIMDNSLFPPKDEENKSLSDKNLEKINIGIAKDKLRHSSVFEILGIKSKEKRNYDRISSEFKKYEKQFNINISYSNKQNLKFDIPIEASKIINILSLPTEQRTFDDVFLIKKYLLTTKIEDLFKDEFNNKEESIDKLLTFFGLEMRYRLFQKDDVVFRIGDSSVYLFLIIQGKAEILKPIVENKPMTGYEYFSYLLDLKNNDEEYLLNLSINENLKAYEMDRGDIDLLPAIYILNILEEFKIYQNINFEEALRFVGMDPEEFGLDPAKINSNEYIFLRIKQIKDKLSYVSQDLVNKYNYIINHNENKQVSIYKYSSFLKLEKDSFFGESAMGENQKRNATIKVCEDSYLGYLSASLYKTNFFAEKKLVMENKINFLHSRFFFSKIALKRFEKKYFNLFILESYINGNIIFNENDPINYVYFIEEGVIELYSSKTMLEIEIFLQGLQNKILLNDESSQLTYKNILSNTEDLQSYLNRTQKNKLLILGKYEMIGLESFYYNIPYFTSARVTSSRAKIFKIGIEQLWQILNIEIESFYEFQNLVLNKIKIFKKRFFGINNTKLSILDEKINFNYQQEYFKNLEKKIKSQDETTIKSQKNNLMYNEIKIKTLFKSKTNRNYPLPVKEKSDEKHKLPKKTQKKLNYFSLFKINDNKEKNNSLILNNSSEQEKVPSIIQKERDNKRNTFLEDKLLNKLKNQIKLLNNNKYFFSQIKLPLDRQKSLDEKEEKSNRKFYEEENDIIFDKKEKYKKSNSNELDISNSKDENNNIIKIYSKKSFKSNLFDTQIKFKKNNNYENNSTSSILPSIYSARNKNQKNIHKSFSLIYNDKNNNSYMMNASSEKIIYNNCISPNNNRSKISSFFSEKYNKSLFDKRFIGVKKFSNFYEIKNNFQKEKFKFYNESEFFAYKKKEDKKNFEIKNLKEEKDDKGTIRYFIPNNIQIKNKEIISKIINNKNKFFS